LWRLRLHYSIILILKGRSYILKWGPSSEKVGMSFIRLKTNNHLNLWPSRACEWKGW
jgi:hypothetical protein